MLNDDTTVLVPVCPICGGKLVGEETWQRKLLYAAGIYADLDNGILQEENGVGDTVAITETLFEMRSFSYSCENGHTEDQIVAAVDRKLDGLEGEHVEEEKTA